VDSRLAVALDTSDRRQALAWVKALAPAVGTFKVGLELFSRHGPGVVEEIAGAGVRIFLDLKLHDIPHTVGRAVAAAREMPGVRLLTVHVAGGRAMMRAAVDAAGSVGVLGVTVLTSLCDDDLRAAGVLSDAGAQAMRLARLATDSGLHGLVCSPLEVASLRSALGPGALLVTPGVRPAGTEPGDQKRTATPAQAIRDGASMLVIGRPITGAASPLEAARRILDSLP
jgi:orotidine-5'-phosphate decarboxylase